MEWLSKFEVGNEKIDLEHRVFFDLVKGIAEANENGDSRDRIRRLVAETMKYAEFHFLSEENMMIDVNYPEFEEHHEHHNALMRKLQLYTVKFESGDDNISELINFLVEWFSEHTTNEDLMLSRYIRQA